MSSSSATKQKLAAVQDQITEHDHEIKRLERRLEDLRDERKAAKTEVAKLKEEVADAKKRDEKAAAAKKAAKKACKHESDDSDCGTGWSSDDAEAVKIHGGRHLRVRGRAAKGKWEEYAPQKAWMRDHPDYRYRCARRGLWP